MELRKITSWTNWNEWKSVVDDAYNPDEDLNRYRRAFTNIIAWESRDSSMPPSLVGLKELLIAKMYQIDKTTASNEQVYFYQNNLAMCLIRFVNFLTEPYQTAIYAKPIKAIANQIGLPDWIVNLRHNATHYSLPSIEVMEKARDFLFEWLKERYIDTYSEIAIEKSVLDNVKVYIVDMFNDYMNIKYKTMVMKNKNKTMKKTDSDFVEKIEEVNLQFRNETFEILMNNGLLIPTKEQLNAIGIVAEEFVEDEQVEMPKSYLNLWMDYLQVCDSNNLIGYLFQKLVSTYRSEVEHGSGRIDNLRSKFLLAWILCLVKQNSYKNDAPKNAKFNFEYNPIEVLNIVLNNENPSKYSMSFLYGFYKVVASSNEISKSQYDKLHNLILLMNQNILDNQDESMETNNEDVVPNLDIFESNKTTAKVPNGHNFFNKKANLSGGSHWKLIDDNNWNHDNYKIGLLEGQTIETVNFDLSQFYTNKDKQSPTELNASLNESRVDESSSPVKPTSNSLFGPTKVASEKLNSLKRSFFNDYWEFDSRENI